MTQFGELFVNFTVWRLWISERRLAIDDGFNSAIQEILQVEDVIFTWRSRGVLNDTIQRYFGLIQENLRKKTYRSNLQKRCIRNLFTLNL